MGSIYLMRNPAFPDYIKIGRTKGTTKAAIEKRRKQLSNTSVPFEFLILKASVVNDGNQPEVDIRNIFKDKRVNESKEFFKINPELVIALLKHCEIEDVTPKPNDNVKDKNEQMLIKIENTRQANFTFSSVGIPIGAVISFVRNENYIATVVDDKKNWELTGMITIAEIWSPHMIEVLQLSRF